MKGQEGSDKAQTSRYCFERRNRVESLLSKTTDNPEGPVNSMRGIEIGQLAGWF